MLSIEVSERTVSRFMPRRPADPEARQRWRTFLANHRELIAAMDFFTVTTVTFRVLYVFFVIRHARRTVLHYRVTAHPTTAWITQQLREAFPCDEVPRHLIFDRDAKYGDEVLAMIANMGIRARQIAARSPRQNGVAERLFATSSPLGTSRRTRPAPPAETRGLPVRRPRNRPARDRVPKSLRTPLRQRPPHRFGQRLGTTLSTVIPRLGVVIQTS